MHQLSQGRKFHIPRQENTRSSSKNHFVSGINGKTIRIMKKRENSRPEVEGEHERKKTYENVFLSAPIIFPDFHRKRKRNSKILMKTAGYDEIRDKGYPFAFFLARVGGKIVKSISPLFHSLRTRKVSVAELLSC